MRDLRLSWPDCSRLGDTPTVRASAGLTPRRSGDGGRRRRRAPAVTSGRSQGEAGAGLEARRRLDEARPAAERRSVRQPARRRQAGRAEHEPVVDQHAERLPCARYVAQLRDELVGVKPARVGVQERSEDGTLGEVVVDHAAENTRTHVRPAHHVKVDEAWIDRVRGAWSPGCSRFLRPGRLRPVGRHVRTGVHTRLDTHRGGRRVFFSRRTYAIVSALRIASSLASVAACRKLCSRCP